MGEDHLPMVCAKTGKPQADKPQQTVFVDVERNSLLVMVSAYLTDYTPSADIANRER